MGLLAVLGLAANLLAEVVPTLHGASRCFQQQLTLASGTWSLRVGVVDLGSGEIGTLDLQIHIP